MAKNRTRVSDRASISPGEEKTSGCLPVQSPEVARLAARYRRASKKKRLIDVAEQFNVFDNKGRPSPGLVHLIAFDNYEPGPTVKIRLGIRSRCRQCGARLTARHNHIPPEYERAADLLASLETAAGQPDKERVYTRKGKRA
jgi:hypothetical protein